MKQQTRKPILVMGAGSWGTALALLLYRNGNKVRLWSFDPKQVSQINTLHENPTYLPGIEIPNDIMISNTLDDLIEDVEDVLIVVPSVGFRDAVIALKKAKPQGLRIVWGTKGLDPHSHQMLSQVVCEHYAEDTSIAVLSGPSFAKEVALMMPTAISLAGNDEAFNNELVARFHSQTFRVYFNPDIVGVELCGVVKNIMAIAVGISDGIGFGANARCALITRGLAEMGRLCAALGGEQQTLLSLAGIGDLVLTCTDDQSRNRRFGLLIGRERSIDHARQEIGQAIEGYSNVKQLYELAEQCNVDMPIAAGLYRVLYEGADIRKEVLALMGRDPSNEHL